MEEAINASIPIPRSDKTAFIVAMEIITRLDEIYSEVFGENEEWFIDNTWKDMFDNADTNGDSIVELMLDDCADQEKKTTLITALYIFPIHIACAYAVQAMKAFETNNNLAWAFASDASYWLGVLNGNITPKSL